MKNDSIKYLQINLFIHPINLHYKFSNYLNQKFMYDQKLLYVLRVQSTQKRRRKKKKESQTYIHLNSKIAMPDITTINAADSKFYLKQFPILSLARQTKWKIKSRPPSYEIFFPDKILNKLISNNSARQRNIIWYRQQNVQHQPRVKPHPHLGPQRLQCFNGAQHLHLRALQLCKNKVNPRTATNIYFEDYVKPIVTTPACRPATSSRIPQASSSATAPRTTSPTSQRSLPSPDANPLLAFLSH